MWQPNPPEGEPGFILEARVSAEGVSAEKVKVQFGEHRLQGSGSVFS